MRETTQISGDLISASLLNQLSGLGLSTLEVKDSEEFQAMT
jgi:hypothetical protein